MYNRSNCCLAYFGMPLDMLFCSPTTAMMSAERPPSRCQQSRRATSESSQLPRGGWCWVPSCFGGWGGLDQTISMSVMSLGTCWGYLFGTCRSNIKSPASDPATNCQPGRPHSTPSRGSPCCWHRLRPDRSTSDVSWIEQRNSRAIASTGGT